MGGAGSTLMSGRYGPLRHEMGLDIRNKGQRGRFPEDSGPRGADHGTGGRADRRKGREGRQGQGETQDRRQAQGEGEGKGETRGRKKGRSEAQAICVEIPPFVRQCAGFSLLIPAA